MRKISMEYFNYFFNQKLNGAFQSKTVLNLSKNDIYIEKENKDR